MFLTNLAVLTRVISWHVHEAVVYTSREGWYTHERDSRGWAEVKAVFQTDACCLPFNENISACAFILWTVRHHLWSQLLWEPAEHLLMPQSHTVMSSTCASDCSSYSLHLNKVAQLGRFVFFITVTFSYKVHKVKCTQWQNPLDAFYL